MNYSLNLLVILLKNYLQKRESVDIIYWCNAEYDFCYAMKCNSYDNLRCTFCFIYDITIVPDI